MSDDLKYIRFNPFEGDRDTDVKLQTIKLVKVKKEHPCFMGSAPFATPHTIKKGEKARYEKSLCDGSWHISYVCLNCIDKELSVFD